MTATTLPDFSLPAMRFVNHVLGQNAWARATLRHYVGRTVTVSALPLVFHWVITPEGLVQALERGTAAKNGSHQGTQADAQVNQAADTPADVALSMPLASLPQFALDAEGAMQQVRIEGDAEFAQALGQLVRQVRWDAEDDIARITGGILAHRLMQGAQSLHATARDAAARLQETVSAFLLDEDPTLVRRAAAQQFAREVSTLRDDVARLEKRLERLEI